MPIQLPVSYLKYMVAIGNFVHLILWTLLETWILIALILSLMQKTNTDQWVYVKCSPIVFYIMITKFFGFYGALSMNYLYMIIHIMLNIIYFLAIALSILHLTVFAEDIANDADWLQVILAQIYHVSNFFLLVLAVCLFLRLREFRSSNSSRDRRTESERSPRNTDSVESTSKASTSEVGNDFKSKEVFNRLVPKDSKIDKK